MSKQGSKKKAKRSTAQKFASSRHNFDPIPATSPVAGAFGRRGRVRSSETTPLRTGKKAHSREE